MIGNKEIQAGILALNIRLDAIERKLDKLQESLDNPASEKPEEPSPFLTKEGLFNYKHRKPVPKE